MYAPILARAEEKVKLNIADIYAEDGGRNPANGTLRQNADETLRQNADETLRQNADGIRTAADGIRTAADRTRTAKRKKSDLYPGWDL